MKKQLLVLVWAIISFTALTVSAQTVQRGFSFQGYARDFEGAALASQEISVQFSIYPNGGATEFQEIQTVTTDPYGVFQLTIGASKLADFSKLKFGAKDYWLKVETKAYGSEFVEITNTQLLAMPYAKSAENALNGIPAGTILPFAGTSGKIPAGFLPCDGSQYNTSTYADLFDAIEYAWGGSGSTFRVPDLRGYFLRGVDNGRGTDPDAAGRTAMYTGGNTGDNVGSVQGDQYRSHNHGVSDPGHTHSYTDEVQNSEDSDDADDRTIGSDSRNTLNKTTGSSTTGISIQNNGGSESRPRNAYVLYIIKY